MRRQIQAAMLVLLLLGLGSARRAWAWGCAGHEVVALIAAAHLRPEVAARVRALLAVPVGPGGVRPCRSATGLPPMAQAADWADAARTAATAPWHFVDLPLGAHRNAAVYARSCQDDCLSTELAQAEAMLRRAGAKPAQRAVALRYVIHLVGDAFQPLHVSDDDDRGGNCVRTRLPGQRRRSTLHADWDSGLLRPMLVRGGPSGLARRLETRYGRRYASGSLNPLDWIWSSHAVAERSAYGPLHVSPGCRARTVRVSDRYVKQAQRVIGGQLDRAGWRLAAVLNAVLMPPVKD